MPMEVVTSEPENNEEPKRLDEVDTKAKLNGEAEYDPAPFEALQQLVEAQRARRSWASDDSVDSPRSALSMRSSLVPLGEIIPRRRSGDGCSLRGQAGTGQTASGTLARARANDGPHFMIAKSLEVRNKPAALLEDACLPGCVGQSVMAVPRVPPMF